MVTILSSRSTILLLLAALLLPVAVPAAGPPPPPVPFHLPLPDGWHSETLTFPLGFAPDLPYRGLEELRFAPGMFDINTTDFWTYAFVWWINEDASVAPDDLAASLQIYFAGLSTQVANQRDMDLTHARYQVELMAVDPSTGSDMVGQATTFDSFVTGRNLVLYLRVRVVPCPGTGHVAVIFDLSPRAFDDESRQMLKTVVEGFGCP